MFKKGKGTGHDHFIGDMLKQIVTHTHFFNGFNIWATTVECSERTQSPCKLGSGHYTTHI